VQRSVFIQGLLVLLTCAVIELFSGSFLQQMEGYFTSILPGVIIMVPPLLGLRGNINGAFASRLGTGLHLGSISPKLKLTQGLKVNLLSTLVLSLIASFSIGVFTWVVGLFTASGTIPVLEIVMIAVIAGFTSGVILALLTIFVAVASYLRGWDPDNITAPLMASVGDLVTVLSIWFAVLVVSLV